MPKKNDIAVGVISKINVKNKGVIYLDDAAKAYVPDAYEGQEVEVRLLKKRKGNWEARLERVIKNPSYYIAAKCKFFGACGGCALQNLPYEKQLERKLRWVNQILNFEVAEILGSPKWFQYRNKMEYTFGDTVKDGPLALGLHKKRTTFDIVTVDDCKIVDDGFNAILRATLDFFAVENVPYYKKVSHQGFLKFLVVRRSETTGEFLVNIVTSSQIAYDFTAFVEAIKNTGFKIAGVLHTISDSPSDAIKPDSVELLYGLNYIYEEILGLKFKISPFSFFQTNTKGAEVLYANALALLSDLEDKTVFDLYSGTGTIAQIMALKAKKVVGIEIVAEAVAAAKENAKLNGLENCEFIAGDVLTQIDNADVGPDVIVVDPPRDGIHRKALEKIINFGVAEILYISCKATSLARDLVAFAEGGYHVAQSLCVDMFAQTYHVETVVLLKRTNHSDPSSEN
ncbi:23S rRNA (uracil(1939)-C(5))-methyltransferase RlmD [Candidatus Epulonipiscium viviparus]|uniref:23S rRNA (uracil(1939)-C(5))-methyltransferase RlmD n=1 Tax=Candidatus Epulonipiscium viviparus TaxID=420336 RepID=UPI0027381469|nr:23S rRNA (uracil(1939)-C(5))-methyltransferase RlmD [Candidatus Epulopiscium viviparus]